MFEWLGSGKEEYGLLEQQRPTHCAGCALCNDWPGKCPTSKTEGVASTLQLSGIEGRLELPGNAWVNSLVGVYHLSPKDIGSPSHSNLHEDTCCA